MIPAPPPAGAAFAWQMVRERPDLGTREWFGPVTPEVGIGLSVNNAVFAGQDVPARVPRLSTATVSVRMRNAGNTTWTPATAYRLGAVGHDFGAARHELSGPVAPGGIATFTFLIPPPARPETFQWQMVQEGVEWFGERSTAVPVTDAEPTACAAIRGQIRGFEASIERLQDDLSTASPQEKPGIVSAIKEAQKDLKKAERQASDLGCGR